MFSGMSDENASEATIDLAALRANAEEASRLARGREIFAVVKANAYGHGAVECARCLLEVGCSYLVVTTTKEAAELRSAGLVAPILVLAGARNADEAGLAISLQLTPVLQHDPSLELIRTAARAAGRRARVHVEVDTGMSRCGVSEADAVEFLDRVARDPALELDGVFTHFSRADEKDLAPTLEQLRRFRVVLEGARARGLSPLFVHAANSAGVVAGDELADALPEATAVRPGLMLYGIQPSERLHADLRPVMTLRARVSRVQDLAAGESVGYGATYTVPGRGGASGPTTTSRIATLGLGYADGISCSAGNRGWVWIAGKRHPIAGRVSMDSIGVDVGNARVEVGDEAVIFGNSQLDEGGISLEEAAAWCETIPYELLVRVGQRVPRIFLG